MARRYKAPVEKPKNPRLPHDFIEVVLLGTIMNNGTRALAESVEPPPALCSPETTGMWAGDRMDDLFGMGSAKAIARRLWHNYELTRAEAAARAPEAVELCEGDVYVSGPAMRVVNLRIPWRPTEPRAMVVQTSMRTFYPTVGAQQMLGYSVNGYTSRIHPLRHVDWRTLNGVESAWVKDFYGWGQDTMVQRERAADAAGFINTLLTCASIMQQAYDMLPDLANIFSALGINGDYIRASNEPLRGAMQFDRARFYRLEPQWALDWAKHRTTLLSMAMAANNSPKVPDGTVAVWHHYTHSTDLKD